MQKTVAIPVDQLLGGLDAKTLAAALLERLIGNNIEQPAPHTGEIPMIGQRWPGQGGVNGGLVRGHHIRTGSDCCAMNAPQLAAIFSLNSGVNGLRQGM